MAMALKGLKVVEMAGLAPAPFCGMILADFGADVTRVDKTGVKFSQDSLARGKKSVAVNLKKPEGVEVVRKMCSRADVLIEPYRQGVMEKLGLGPDKLLRDNPRLIYSRLTGFGQSGPLAKKAGHDINYIAISGVLSKLGRKHENPYPPVNLLADFAGGGLTCALGILLALYERNISGKGQVIDANMVQGSAYVSTFIWSSMHRLPIWSGARGTNWLDGGSAFYGTYKTKDDKYVSVGPLEPQFYKDLLKGLGIDKSEIPQSTEFSVMEDRFAKEFLTKTREEWNEVFKDLDACYAPILEFHEAEEHEHNKEIGTFIKAADGHIEPAPAPRLSRTPGVGEVLDQPDVGQNTREELIKLGYTEIEIDKMIADDILYQFEDVKAKL